MGFGMARMILDRGLCIAGLAAAVAAVAWFPACAVELDAKQGSSVAPADTFSNFKKGLREDNGLFLLNGYWLSEDEIRSTWQTQPVVRSAPVQSKGLIQKNENQAPGTEGAEPPRSDPRVRVGPPDLSLNVNLVDGRPDYWADPKDRLLTYAILRSSLTDDQYRILKEALQEAMGDWEAACPQCGIKFEHKRELDDSTEAELKSVLESAKIRFMVVNEANGPGYGYTFFPGAPVNQRILAVGTKLLESKMPPPAGFLRHQMGHILGYRHEHISSEAPEECKKRYGEESPNYMTGAYDPVSVMHYPCGGAGSPDYALSAGDKLSHQILYGESSVLVELEGKNILSKVAAIFKALRATSYQRLTYEPYDIQTTEGCSAYIKALGLEDELKERSVTTPSCSIFSRLEKEIDGKLHMPLLLFSSYVDVASGSVSYKDKEGLDFFATLKERVVPLKLSVDNTDEQSLRYSLAWQKYRANIPVGQFEQNVWGALKGLSEDGRGISVTLGQSIDETLAAQNKAIKYSVDFELKHPVDDKEEICKPQAAATGHYAMLHNNNLSFEPLQPQAGAQEIPDLTCDDPVEFKESCEDCASCFEPRCRHCLCAKEKRAIPDVFVVDKSIDLDALKSASLASSPAASNICKWNAPDNKTHHGTLMAQIVVGWNKFIGFVPGVEPKFIKTEEDPSFIQTIGTAFDPPPGVVVLTSQICHAKRMLGNFGMKHQTNACELLGSDHPRADNEQEIAEYEKQLVSNHPATGRITKLGNLLWVSAIGQPEGSESVSSPPPPTTFTSDTVAMPIALASWPNVLLVSACENCSIAREGSTQDRKLWRQAHRGLASVQSHVMAPGGVEFRRPLGGEFVGGIPGFGRRDELTEAYGTSQSAAFAAGVASKMMACYPQYYGHGREVKEAIQISTAPVYEPNDAKFVATGLVDVRSALRHPEYAYLQPRGAGDAYKRLWYKAMKWCRSEFTFESANGKQTIESDRIRRIARVKSGDTNRWIIYFISPNDDGTVKRSPLIIDVEGDSVSDDLIADGDRVYKLGDIQDLMTFRHLQSGKCDKGKNRP